MFRPSRRHWLLAAFWVPAFCSHQACSQNKISEAQTSSHKAQKFILSSYLERGKLDPVPTEVFHLTLSLSHDGEFELVETEHGQAQNKARGRYRREGHHIILDSGPKWTLRLDNLQAPKWVCLDAAVSNLPQGDGRHRLHPLIEDGKSIPAEKNQNATLTIEGKDIRLQDESGMDVLGTAKTIEGGLALFDSNAEPIVAMLTFEHDGLMIACTSAMRVLQ